MTTSAAAATLSADAAAGGAQASGDPAAAAAAASAAASTGNTAASGAAAANETWYSSHPDENIRNWAANKGWSDPMAALESGYNLEKLIGFEKAGRTIVLPKEDATPEEQRAFYSKLGVPDKPDGYKLPVPEGQSGEFAQTASQWFHEIGIPPKQAEALAAKWNEYVGGNSEAQNQRFYANSESELSAVRTEWGAAADQNIELAKRAAMQFLPAKDAAERADMLGKLERAIGTGKMMRMFANMGQGLGEHQMHQSGDGGGSMGVMTPAAAKARIESLKSDKEWTAKYLNGDATARAEMERLSKLAVGIA